MTSMTNEYREALRVRFFAKIAVDDTSGCWLWTAAKAYGGYGTIRLRIGGKGVNRIASRVAWMLEHGDFPVESVLHRCDRPACVNPAHLFIGSLADNVADMTKKGRQRHWGHVPGRPTHRATTRKVSDGDIALIRHAIQHGAHRAELAECFGVCLRQIWRIERRESWGQIS